MRFSTPYRYRKLADGGNRLNNKFKWWEAESFAFVRVPKNIFSNSVYKGLSANAALLYGILLDRMSLSVENKGKFTDRYGDVFVYCTLKDIFSICCLCSCRISSGLVWCPFFLASSSLSCTESAAM